MDNNPVQVGLPQQDNNFQNNNVITPNIAQ